MGRLDGECCRGQKFKKTYKDLTAVDNITFDAKKGEILGLLEPTVAVDPQSRNSILGR